MNDYMVATYALLGILVLIAAIFYLTPTSSVEIKPPPTPPPASVPVPTAEGFVDTRKLTSVKDRYLAENIRFV